MPATLLRCPGRLIAPVLAVLSFAAAAIAEPPQIAGLAPSRSFLVVGVPNYKAFSDAFAATELGKLWEEPKVKSFVEEVTSDASKGFADLLKEINAEAKDIHPPQGQVGLALFLPEKKDAPADGPAPDDTPYVLAVADMGEHAGEWEDLLEKLLDKGVRDKKVRVEQDTYQGTPVTVVHPVIDEEAAMRRERWRRGDFRPEDMNAEPDSGGFDLSEWIGGGLDSRRAMRIARVENLFALCTEQRAFEDALDAIKGKAIDSVGEKDDFRRAQDQNAAGNLAWFVMRLEPLFATMDDEGPDEMGLPSMPFVLKVLGLDKVKALSAGVRFDTADAMVDTSFAVLLPEKTGLFELLNTPAGAFEPPAFVPADVAGYSRFTFDFPQVFPVVRRILAQFPEETRASAAPQVELVRDMLNPAFTAMGPAVHMVSSYTRPLSADSANITVAIELRDQEAVANTLSGLAIKAQGMLEPHDFEGNQTYTVDVGGLLKLGIGVGFNNLFIGTESGIRSAMRLAGRPEGAGLAGEPSFKDASRPLSPGAVMYSWADVEQDLRWQYWSLKNQDKIMEQQLEGMGIEPEQRAEWMKGMNEGREWVEKLPPEEVVLPHVGDVASELRPTPEGYRGRIMMLRPRERK